MARVEDSLFMFVKGAEITRIDENSHVGEDPDVRTAADDVPILR